MKKYAIITALFCFGLFLNTAAQNPAAKAKMILDKTSKTFKSWKTVTASIAITIENQAKKTKQTQNGNILLKGNKFKMDLTDQVVYCDGTNLWTHLVDADEVQWTLAKNTMGDINPTNVFTMYEKGYNSVFVGESKEGNKLFQVVDLTPTDKSKDVFKVKLFIDKLNNSINKAQLFNKNGTKTLIQIVQITPNKPLDDKIFSFDKKKFPNVEIVDLRK